jgi:hypothetical protein
MRGTWKLISSKAVSGAFGRNRAVLRCEWAEMSGQDAYARLTLLPPWYRHPERGAFGARQSRPRHPNRAGVPALRACAVQGESGPLAARVG